MKEYKILITIKDDASMSIDAHGFTGGQCLTEIEKLLDDMAQDMEVTKKPEFDKKIEKTAVKRVNMG